MSSNTSPYHPHGMSHLSTLYASCNPKIQVWTFDGSLGCLAQLVWGQNMLGTYSFVRKYLNPRRMVPQIQFAAWNGSRWTCTSVFEYPHVYVARSQMVHRDVLAMWPGYTALHIPPDLLLGLLCYTRILIFLHAY
jgi:hypothetical protein